MSKLFRGAVLLGLLAALCGLIVACGDTPTPTPIPTPTPTPPPTATPLPPTTTSSNDGIGTTGTGTPASASDLSLINDAITQTVSSGSYHFTVTLSVPGFAENTNIEGDYQSPNKAHMTVKGASSTQEIINIGTISYVKNPDGSWTSNDLNAMAGSASAATGGLASGLGGFSSMAGGLDPTQATNLFGTIARFASGITAANVIGTETINGAQTTHYSVPVYLSNLMGAGGSTTPGEAPLGTAGLWVDPSTKLVQRLNLNLDLTDLINAFSSFMPTAGPNEPTATPFPPIKITASMNLSNFGQKVDISAPTNVTPGPSMGTPAAPGGTATP